MFSSLKFVLNFDVKIQGPLISAKFVSRPNRFITIVDVEGKQAKSHLADPGRLKEILIPGVELLIRPAPKKSERKTQYSTIMARKEEQWVSLVSALPNDFVKEELEKKTWPLFKDYRLIRPEIPFEKHRFDFLLETPKGNPFYLEVKSVTFVDKGLAQFPDAVTSRGARHALALKNIVKDGGEAGILFVCQRSDVERFQPMWNRDPVFAHALWDAKKAGVFVACISTKITKTHIRFYREIPLSLEPL
ncbi:MAG: DNA/RNA nuclease SfsA [Candidatus Marinimicrobia bacterium]|jgi:sugar fermentation stimulation protein A|nr:DNA/RNA nuclease SfsA [Candidatus Neomarinimicrobiota bacterium]MBT5355616.1 DNA/RNA nuclease SfsA [Candidatus Neomarinimicrobiota bacterium]MBT6159381.1 DNA/RNA nuclease SfsA [Candidatus Neomarinimicrobiota bacterium]MBT6738156.1 DNA/RNA nuclease SfsA [Candidatus Neomarinimicrobiota bacterium]MBT7185236.1 DNA/RNA nuclease SfsA [Candidatus Neomarinimicrobiota bacterium]